MGPRHPDPHVSVSGLKLRYIEVGSGPTLVLLHTMRTQLDLFQRVIPALAARYRVYAIDLPGHGHSDIPAIDYTASFFIGIVAELLEQIDVEEAVLSGSPSAARSPSAWRRADTPGCGRWSPSTRMITIVGAGSSACHRCRGSS